MSDTVFPTFRKIGAMLQRDLLRFVHPLAWKKRLAQAGLPAPAAELICRVVKRTRLFPLEKVAVSDELAAHFLDGLAHGNSVEQLIEKFGDERAAARLIRRAKRRGRGLLWKTVRAVAYTIDILLAIYAVSFIRFCIGHPTPSVNYLARLNAPIARMPKKDRAWPLWRQAILACSDGSQDGALKFSKAIDTDDAQSAWPQTVDWLDRHAAAIAITRHAAQKPALGFIFGYGGSSDDPVMHFSHARNAPGDPLYMTLLPHVGYLRTMSKVLSLDAKLAATRGEAARVEADLMAILGLGRQLRESGGFRITQLVAIQLNAECVRRLSFVLFSYPRLLNDAMLIKLAHALSGPHVAADLINLTGERSAFEDIVQRVYTDNGHGNGRVTLSGMRSEASIFFNRGLTGRDALAWDVIMAASAVPFANASRAALTSEYDRLMDEAEANLARPIREVDLRHFQLQVTALRQPPVEWIRYWLLTEWVPGFTRNQESCERYLGERDGALVGIALELFRRREGKYPSALNELTPQFLPQVPADRITGDPVKYRLIDGKPVVYSVGADRVDDGGTPASKMKPHFPDVSVATWDVRAKDARRGDWLLFAPPLPEDHEQ